MANVFVSKFFQNNKLLRINNFRRNFSSYITDIRNRSIYKLKIIRSFKQPVFIKKISLYSSYPEEENIDIKYKNGMVCFGLLLPSRKEKCQFTLKSTTSSVNDLIHNMQHEDKGIDRVAIYTLNNERIAKSTPLDVLFQKDFYLVINDRKHYCKVPDIGSDTMLHMGDISSIKNSINHLYTNLYVEQHQIAQEQNLKNQLDHLRMEIEPLERLKYDMDLKARRKTRILTWAGLGLMGIQFGVLARLTWFEYSWDIMEPVTYFVGYATAIACYAYFLLTKQEYILPHVHDREFLFNLYRGSKTSNLDMQRYNHLKNAIAEVDYNLRRLRDPVQLHLPDNLLKKVHTSSNPNFN